LGLALLRLTGVSSGVFLLGFGGRPVAFFLLLVEILIIGKGAADLVGGLIFWLGLQTPCVNCFAPAFRALQALEYVLPFAQTGLYS
jgi:hypothetical protein